MFCEFVFVQVKSHSLGFEPTTVLGSRIRVSSRKAQLPACYTVLCAVRPSRKHFTEVFSLVCKLFARLPQAAVDLSP